MDRGKALALKGRGKGRYKGRISPEKQDKIWKYMVKKKKMEEGLEGSDKVFQQQYSKPQDIKPQDQQKWGKYNKITGGQEDTPL